MEDNNNAQEQVQTPLADRAFDLLDGLVEPKTLNEIRELEKTKPVEKQDPKKDVVDDVKETKKPGVDPKTTIKNADDDGGEEEDGGDEKVKKTDTESEKKEIEIPENKFGFKAKKEDKKENKVKIESFEDIPSVIKTKYGQSIKDAKDLPKFLETVDKWRSDSQNLEKVNKEKENAIAVFENLPADLLEDVKAYYRGEDYKATRENNTLDFSKSADKQDEKKLVKHYFPDDFTDSDFESDEPSKDLKIAIKAAKDRYNLDKTAREQRAKSQVETAKQKEKAFKSSVEGSVKALKSDFPEMADDVVTNIKDTLESGSLVSVFYNSDGTLKANAAKMLALAQHGEEFIGQLMEIAQQRGESRATEEFVERASTKKKTPNSKGLENVRKEVTDTIEDLLPSQLMGKRTF